MELDDEHFMRLALAEAEAAIAHGDVPVGAVIVDEHGEVIGRGRNRREERGDPTAHAEIEALRNSPGSGWRRERTTVFVTMEPCPMCMGGLIQARVGRVVYGATDPKAGAAKSLYRMAEDPRLNHQIEVVPGVLEAECRTQLQGFFRGLREARKRDKER
jgi:tRNA(adenine34) deaminase